MKVAILILLASVFISAQSSKTLRRKYGTPTSVTHTEMYTARRDDTSIQLSVGVAATYTKEMKLCRLKIEVFPYSQDPDAAMTDAERTRRDNLISDVVEEVLPVKERGKRTATGFLSGACSADGCDGSWDRYEKVTIFYNGNSHRYAVINFKGIYCN